MWITCPRCRFRFAYEAPVKSPRPASTPAASAPKKRRTGSRKFILAGGAFLLIAAGVAIAWIRPFGSEGIIDGAEQTAATEKPAPAQVFDLQRKWPNNDELLYAAYAGDVDARSLILAAFDGKQRPTIPLPYDTLRSWLEEGLRLRHPRIIETHARLQLGGFPPLAIQQDEAAARQSMESVGHIDFGRGFAAVALHYHQLGRGAMRDSYSTGNTPSTDSAHADLARHYQKKAAEAGHRGAAGLHFTTRYDQNPQNLAAIRDEIAALKLTGPDASAQKDLIRQDFEKNRLEVDARLAQLKRLEQKRREAKAQEDLAIRNSEQVINLIRQIDALDFSFRAPPRPPSENANVQTVNRYIENTRKWGFDFEDHINRQINRRNALSDNVFKGKTLPITLETKKQLDRNKTEYEKRVEDARERRDDALRACDKWRHDWKERQERAHFWRSLGESTRTGR